MTTEQDLVEHLKARIRVLSTILAIHEQRHDDADALLSQVAFSAVLVSEAITLAAVLTAIVDGGVQVLRDLHDHALDRLLELDDQDAAA